MQRKVFVSSGITRIVAPVFAEKYRPIQYSLESPYTQERIEVKSKKGFYSLLVVLALKKLCPTGIKTKVVMKI